MDEYVARLDTVIDEVKADVTRYLWLSHDFVATAAANLSRTRSNVEQLSARAVAARDGFAALPRLAVDDRTVPAAIDA